MMTRITDREAARDSETSGRASGSAAPVVARRDDYPALLICVLLAILVAPCVVRLAHTSAPPPPTVGIQSKVNPNTAPWWELTVLPRIGETKAKAIVEHRETARAVALAESAPSEDGSPTDTRVFKEPADLDAVYRIGVKTIEQMSPHLRFD